MPAISSGAGRPSRDVCPAHFVALTRHLMALSGHLVTLTSDRLTLHAVIDDHPLGRTACEVSVPTVDDVDRAARSAPVRGTATADASRTRSCGRKRLV